MSVFEIKTVADFSRAEFCYEETKQGVGLYARLRDDAQDVKRTIVVVLGSKDENNGLEVQEAPDEVVNPAAREKKKLILEVARDDDMKKLLKLDGYAKQAYEKVFGHAPQNWYDLVTGNNLKLKIHPKETLIAEFAEGTIPEWKYVGGGLPAKPGVPAKRKADSSLEQGKAKRGRPAKEQRQGTLSMELDEPPKKHGTIDMAEDYSSKKHGMGDCSPASLKKLHYVLYSKDVVVVKAVVDGVWSATFERGESAGLVLVANHIVRLRQSPAKPAVLEKEIELPTFDGF